MSQVNEGRFVQPATWVRRSRPSASSGVDVAHFKAGETDFEYCLDSQLAIALGRGATAAVESRNDGGRWQSRDISPGVLTLTPNGYRGASRWRGSVEAVCILFDLEWLHGRDDDRRLQLELPVRPGDRPRDRVTQGLIEAVCADNAIGNPLGPMYTEWLALAALARMAASSRKAPMREQASAKWVTDAADYLEENYAEPLPLREVARAAGFDGGLTSFIRAFKRHHGKPPHRYLLDARLDRARSMLQTGAESVTDIALNCGFFSVSHFSSAFKRRWGVSPSAFSMEQHGTPRRAARLSEQ